MSCYGFYHTKSSHIWDEKLLTVGDDSGSFQFVVGVVLALQMRAVHSCSVSMLLDGV